MPSECQRSLVWAGMSDEQLHTELLRLRRRMSDAVETGTAYESQTWRTWLEEVLLEVELRRDDPSNAAL